MGVFNFFPLPLSLSFSKSQVDISFQEEAVA